MKEFVEELIGRLEEETKIYDMSCRTYVSIERAVPTNTAISIVNQLAEEYNNDWISCEKELPQKDMWCLATFESGNVDKIQYLVTNNWSWNGEMRDNRVIAWQPLPAPYQKGE